MRIWIALLALAVVNVAHSADPKPATKLESGSAVGWLALSPDEKTLYSGSKNTIHKWDLTTNKEVAKFDALINRFALSPDGTTLASGYYSPGIRVWDADSGKETKKLPGNENHVYQVAFSPDGKCLASCGDDDKVRLWDVKKGTELKCLSGHQDFVYTVAISSDGKLIASGGGSDSTCGFGRENRKRDYAVRLWDLATSKQRHELRGHKSKVTCLAFASNGDFVASASSDKSVILWRMDKGIAWTTLAHEAAVRCLAISPDGKTVATGGDDHRVRVWETGTQKERACFTGHTKEVTALVFTRDGRSLISASEDGTIQIWDLAPRK